RFRLRALQHNAGNYAVAEQDQHSRPQEFTKKWRSHRISSRTLKKIVACNLQIEAYNASTLIFLSGRHISHRRNLSAQLSALRASVLSFPLNAADHLSIDPIERTRYRFLPLPVQILAFRFFQV